MAANFEIKFDKFDKAGLMVGRGLSNAITALAFAVQDRAVDNIQHIEAIDTGAMRASVYVETSKIKGREPAIEKAISEGQNVGRHSGKPHLETEIASPGTEIDSYKIAKVGVAVNYGVYVEMGVEGAFGNKDLNFPPRPFLTPAAEEVRGEADVVAARFIKDELEKI